MKKETNKTSKSSKATKTSKINSKTTTKKVSKQVKEDKSKAVSNETSTKKSNSNIKLAFYAIFVIIILFILYLVNFKKPKTAVDANENNVISGMLNADVASTEGVALLPLPESFKVYKQSNSNSSATAVLLTLLNYYGSDKVFSEEIVEDMKSHHEPFHDGTCVNQVKEILTTLKFDLYDDKNYREVKELSNASIGASLIEESVKSGYPMIVGWNKEKGQWSLVLGYDNKSNTDISDDEIILANTYDKSNKDTALRVKTSDFMARWTFDDFFAQEPSAQEKKDRCFVIVRKTKE